MNAAQIQTLLQTALDHHRANRWSDAAKLYARVRAVVPRQFDGWHLSGTLALQQQRFVEACDWLAQALKLKPGSALCAMRLGIAWLQRGDFSSAEKYLRLAVGIDASLAEAWGQMGLALRALGRRAEARAAYERAITVKPDFVEVHDRLGALVAETEGHAAAAPHFRRAVECGLNYAPAWSNLGVSLVMLGRVKEAEDCFARALAIQPDYAQALTGRAIAWERSYRLAEAIKAYGEVLAIEPANLDARSARLLGLHYIDGVGASQLAEEHRAYGRVLPAPDEIDFFTSVPGNKSRLRVGFLSPDLREHSVAYFLRPLLQAIDRDRFEIFLYHDHSQVDQVSRELAASADRWQHVAGVPDDALLKLIRQDGPAIMIDLAGHTGGNRLRVFAQRLAPVQVTYLGYPDTTGVPAMDCRFVDAVTDPEGNADIYCTEQLVRFASTAWIYEPPKDAPEVVPLPSTVEGRVTFGCFNNFAKVSDATLAAWAAILSALPGAKLILKGHGLNDDVVLAAQRERLARCGLDPSAVEFLGRTPTTAAHLAMYGRVDVALDTFPYHGTTTTCEALWMGVPVVTLAGDRHASRVGISLLTAIGHPDWVATSWDGYVATAVSVARDVEARRTWRQGLRAELRESPLMDTAGQAARFSDALQQVWMQWQERQAAVAGA